MKKIINLKKKKPPGFKLAIDFSSINVQSTLKAHVMAIAHV